MDDTITASPAHGQEPSATRCGAAHHDDTSECSSPPVVRILDQAGTEVTACVRHGAIMYAALIEPRVYPLPGHGQAAIEVYNRARAIRAGVR